MPMHTKVGGVWKEVTVLYTQVGGVWKAVNQLYVKVSGVWKAVLATLVVSPSNSSVTDTQAGTTYAGVQFNPDGVEYRTVEGGSSYITSLGNWLDLGTAAEVWVQWHRTGGSLGDWNSADAGDARLQLSSSRSWRIASSSGNLNIIGYFEMWDAASGGNLLATTSARTFSATKEL